MTEDQKAVRKLWIVLIVISIIIVVIANLLGFEDKPMIRIEVVPNSSIERKK